MSRIKIQLPEQFSFSTEITVRITDLNYGGHVGNDSILSLVHEARMRYLHQFGYTEMNLEGVGLIMSDAAIEFKNESFYGDTIQVFVQTSNAGRAGFDIYYKLVKKDTASVIALVKTGMICYNYQTKKVVSIPDKVKLALSL